MVKSSPSFTCQSCGVVTSKWAGKCESCGGWNTIVEEAGAIPIGGGRRSAKARTPVRDGGFKDDG